MAADLTEEELLELARVAHAAYYASTEFRGVRVGSTPFEALHPMWQRAWVAAARAVADKLTATTEPTAALLPPCRVHYPDGDEDGFEACVCDEPTAGEDDHVATK